MVSTRTGDESREERLYFRWDWLKMGTGRFDKFLSRVAILAVGGCIVSVFRIALHYCLQIVHSPEQEEHWSRVFPTFGSVFVISLFLALGCLVVYRIRR